MKQLNKLRIILILPLFIFSASIFAQNSVGIGTAIPNPNAILDLVSTDQGLLIPRIDTSTLINTIKPILTAADDGMMVYADEINAFIYWDGDSLDWLFLNAAVNTNNTDDDWSIQGDTMFAGKPYVVIGGSPNPFAKLSVESNEELGLYVSNQGTVNSVGLQSLAAGGSAINVAISAEAYSSINDTTIGVSAEAFNVGTIGVGVSGTASGYGNGSRTYGGLLFATGASSDTAYGLFSYARNASVNFAGYFSDGYVFVQDTLIVGGNPYGAGAILQAADISGKLVWANPLAGTSGDNDWDTTAAYVYNITKDIGIGTASPTAKLEVKPPASYFGSMLKLQNDNISNGATILNINTNGSGTAFNIDQSGFGKGMNISNTNTGSSSDVASFSSNGNSATILRLVHTGGGGSSTDYALYADVTGSGTNNIGGYFSAVGATNNYAGIFDKGFVGIGTTTPDTTLHVVGNIKMVDGNQAVGSVLTSDANGVGYWAPAAGGADADWIAGGGVVYNQTDNVGVGLLPTEKFQVGGSGSSLSIDQSASSSGAFSALTAWQSFTVANTGDLQEIAVNVTWSGIPFDINIYAGEGTGGALLHSITNVNSFVGLTRYSLGANVPVVSGSQYTFELVGAHPISYNHLDPYPGGRASISPASDLEFETWVLATVNSVVLSANTSTNRVGIGTGSPASVLDVQGDINLTQELRMNGNQGASGQILTSQGAGSPPVWQAVGGSVWGLSGNSGTSAGANFIGTTDAQDLQFKVNNATAMTIDDATQNFGMGTVPAFNNKVEIDVPSTNTTTTTGLYVDHHYAGAATATGMHVQVSANGTAAKFGLYSDVTQSATSIAYGNYNVMHHVGSGNSAGTYNLIDGSGTGEQFGTYNELSNNGTGYKYGTYNKVIQTAASGANWANGVSNYVSHLGTGYSNGVYNDFQGSTGTGVQNGVYTVIPDGSGAKNGVFNTLTQAGGSNTVSGVYNVITNNGTGQTYGMYALLTGTSTDKYGVFVSGEDKSYFSNRVGIGISTPNTPLEVNGVISQTREKDKYQRLEIGANDLVSFCYGNVDGINAAGASPQSVGVGSTANFSVDHQGTGRFTITYDGTRTFTGSEVMVLVSADYKNGQPVVINYSVTGSKTFDVYLWDVQGNSPIDEDFSFSLYGAQ